MIERYYTVRQVAGLLNMAEGTVRNRLSRGEEMPPSDNIFGKRLFPVDEFHQWLDEKMSRQ